MDTIILIDMTNHGNVNSPTHFMLYLHDYPYTEEPRIGHVLPLENAVAKDAHTCHFGEKYLEGIYAAYFSVISGQISDVIPKEKYASLPPGVTPDDTCFRMYILKQYDFPPNDPVRRLTPVPLC